MNDVSTKLSTAVKLATRNVMSPGLWLCVVVGLPCVSGAVIAKGWIAIWLLSIFTVLTIGSFAVFVRHSFISPNLLQSEDYLLKRDAMTIYGSSSYTGQEIVTLLNSDSKSEKVISGGGNG